LFANSAGHGPSDAVGKLHDLSSFPEMVKRVDWALTGRQVFTKALELIGKLHQSFLELSPSGAAPC
jgi:hypothetical protein